MNWPWPRGMRSERSKVKSNAPVKEQITNSPDALLRRKYRPNHWAVPKGV